MAKLVISHVDFARVWFQVSYCMVRLLSSSPPPPLPPFFPLSLSVLFLSCTCVHTAVTHTSCASRSGNNTSDREGGRGEEREIRTTIDTDADLHLDPDYLHVYLLAKAPHAH